MMKIVKRGVAPEDIKHCGTCSHCKTEVEFMRREGKITYDQRDGDFVTVACPVCGHPIHSYLNQRLR